VSFGYRIKLLGTAKAHPGDAVEVHVCPTMIPRASLLAKVDGAMNAVTIHGDAVGPTFYYGAGAGEMPTASAVVGDLMEIAREIVRGVSGRVAPLSYPVSELESKPLVPLSELRARCYLRFAAVDRPGVLSHLAGALGENGIGIESLIQRRVGSAGKSVPVIILTHPALEGSVRKALRQIDALPDVTAPTQLIRIDEEM
jgi:homoserine dehydrogenase